MRPAADQSQLTWSHTRSRGMQRPASPGHWNMEAGSQSSLEEVVALEVTLEVILEVGAACEVMLAAGAGWQCAPASSLPSSQSLSPSHTQSGSTHCNTAINREYREWTDRDRRYYLVPTGTGPAVSSPAVAAPDTVSAWTNQRRVLPAVSTNPRSPVSAPGPGWAPHSASSLPSPQSLSPSHRHAESTHAPLSTHLRGRIQYSTVKYSTVQYSTVHSRV